MSDCVTGEKPIFFFMGCESWEGNAADTKTIEAFDMWCWRRTMCISWIEKRQMPMLEILWERSKTLMSEVNRCILGCISRRDGNSFENIIMEGMVKGHLQQGTTSEEMDGWCVEDQ